MESTDGLRKGTMVQVSKNLDATKRRYNLDGTGYMLKMAGKVFPVKEINSRTSIRIRCEDAGRSFIFTIRDIEMPEVKEPDPVIFEFDTQHLDI